MFSNASSCSSAESSKHERWNIIALAVPSLRSKHQRIFEILFRVMVTLMHDSHKSSFLYWQLINIIIILCLPQKQENSRTIHSSRFFLDVINVFEIFEILITIIICFHISLDLLP